jgi:hypothetical protein
VLLLLIVAVILLAIFPLLLLLVIALILLAALLPSIAPRLLLTVATIRIWIGGKDRVSSRVINYT